MKTFIEKDCTFKSHTALGAVVSDSHIVAYPGEAGKLKDWHGNVIGTYRVLSSRPAVFFGYRSWQGSEYYFMRATVNGVEYSLRGFGEGMIAKGKRIK